MDSSTPAGSSDSAMPREAMTRATDAAAETNGDRDARDSVSSGFGQELIDDLALESSSYSDPTVHKAHDFAGNMISGDLTSASEAESGRPGKGSQNHCFHNNPCMSRLHKVVSTVVPKGGLISNVYNLASATLGAGIVSVPSGFHDSGIVVAIILLVVVAACTIYSLRLLALTTEKTGLHSYEQMARGLLGRGWDYFAAFLMFIFCWGTCIGYVISVGDLLTPMLEAPNTNAFLQTPNGKRLLIGLVWLVGMFTLSLPKEINSLRFASVVGVCFVIFFVICVIIHSCQNGLKGGFRSDLILANTGMEAVNGLSLFIFAFLNQVNQPEIYEEMQKPTPRKMTRDAAVSMTLVMLLNFFSGFFGYCDFGEAVTGSILLLYKPREDVLFMISYIGICVKLCVGFAICVQPTRDAIYYCLGWGRTADVKYWVNWLISGFIALTALICGLFIPNISIVFQLLGGICGGFLGFMFPAYFYMYAGGFTLRNVGWLNYFGCIVLIIGGVVAVVFGTGAAIYSEVTSP